MTWISLVCLLALSSTVFGRSIRSSGYGGYGSTRVLSAPVDSYGSTRVLQAPVDSYGSTRVLPPVNNYGSTRVLPPVNNYGSTRVLPPVNNYGSSRFLPAPVDSYGSTRVLPPVNNYGSTRVLPPAAPTGYGYSAPLAPPMTRAVPVASYGGYGSSSRSLDGFDRSIDVLPPPPPTQADILCRGQQPETVIPIENNRKFVVCLDDGKGVEQICPGNLLYHEQLRRCERKLGPLNDWCVSQPCLNGGQCISGEHTFQCQCPSGFDGIVCELDARTCQLNRPCGSDPSVRCQSFRAGAALQWICVSDDDSTYGPDGQHVHRSACDGLNGPHALAYTSAGFIMCDGERSHYESCPGGTIWDNLNKACVWPDMDEGITDTRIIKSGFDSSYNSLPAPTTRVFSSYGQTMLPPPETKVFSSYGGDSIQRPETKVFSSYGQSILPPPETKVFSSYGQTVLPPPETKVFSSYGGDSIQRPETKVFSSYGQSILPPPETKVFSSYGGDLTPPPMPITKSFSSYGGDSIPPPVETKSFSSYGGDSLPPPVETKSFSSYGGSRMIHPQPQVKSTQSYGGY